MTVAESLGMQALAVLVALAVDRAFGEPPVRLHPVVWMGAYLGRLGRWVAPLATATSAGALRPWLRGAAAWWLGAVVVVIAALGVQQLLLSLPLVAAAVVLGLVLKPLLAWRMLRDEVAGVEHALGTSLAQGRERLSRLVSRDVSALQPPQVREAAIETLAENLNDSVVAPLFWFVVAGLPGAALYRFANTADAMWGYPAERHGRVWTLAGRWAARADDVLSWLPARLTALLLLLPGSLRLLRRLPAQAGRTPSPNSGWPMAAMALKLDVCLSKPGVYALHPGGRSPEPGDTARALGAATRVVWTLAGAAVALLAVEWAQ